MRSGVERSIDTRLSRSPVQRLFTHRASSRLAVLAYHAIDDASNFSAHLDLLQRENHPVSVEQVAAAVRGEQPLPDRSVLITFDDAGRTHLEVAAPALNERGIPALAFVVTGVLGTQNPYWWSEAEQLVRLGGMASGMSGDPDAVVGVLKRVDDARRLSAMEELRQTSSAAPQPAVQLTGDDLVRLESAGVTVGNHTVSHPLLPRCPDQKVRDEILGAHEALSSILGHPPIAFAYPNGDWSPVAQAVAADAGYQLGFVFDHRLQQMPTDEPLRISRLRVGSRTSVDRLAITLSGLHPMLHRLVGRP